MWPTAFRTRSKISGCSCIAARWSASSSDGQPFDRRGVQDVEMRWRIEATASVAPTLSRFLTGPLIAPHSSRMSPSPSSPRTPALSLRYMQSPYPPASRPEERSRTAAFAVAIIVPRRSGASRVLREADSERDRLAQVGIRAAEGLVAAMRSPAISVFSWIDFRCPESFRFWRRCRRRGSDERRAPREPATERKAARRP
jgi:hypothetical protein